MVCWVGTRCVTLTLWDVTDTTDTHSIAFGSDASAPRLLLLRDDTMFARPERCSSGRKLNGHVEVKYYINRMK